MWKVVSAFAISQNKQSQLGNAMLESDMQLGCWSHDITAQFCTVYTAVRPHLLKLWRALAPTDRPSLRRCDPIKCTITDLSGISDWSDEP